MGPQEEAFLVDRADGVVIVRLAHAESRNSLDVAAFTRLSETLRAVDPSQDRLLVVSSATPGVFCSGLRLGPGAGEAVRSGEIFALVDETFAALAACPVPTLALVDGSAIGAGCELALRCDVRIASERAAFGIPAATLGMPYPVRSLRFLVDRYGADPFRLIFLAGARLSGDEAYALGLVQRLVPDGAGLEDELATVIDHVRRSAPLVLRYTKQALAEGDFDPEAAQSARHRVLGSKDFERAVAAMAERSRATFTGD